MIQYYTMSQTIGADMESRFYINGRRVSREYFDCVQTRARMTGTIDCFSTRARQLPGGKIRRTNYCVARY